MFISNEMNTKNIYTITHSVAYTERDKAVERVTHYVNSLVEVYEGANYHDEAGKLRRRLSKFQRGKKNEVKVGPGDYIGIRSLTVDAPFEYAQL